ncbi:MAG: heat-inducible transcriptional repressor HrcA [Chloroflexota bacterium]|nr:heat-inducible transcriptional repressor HrcA [Chloroflexota bacterium]
MNSDESHLPELTRRQEEILAYIVKAYTDTPEPVSSKYLVERFNLTYSSATIRNEMVALEELGAIQQPHTSAGRVPTEMGYRYFVKRLLMDRDGDSLDTRDQHWIDERLKSAPVASEQQMTQAASALARVAGTAALVTQPQGAVGRFKHIELIAVQGRLALMVLVLQGGSVHQQMLTLAEALMQPRLSETSARLNANLPNLSAGEVRARSVALTLLDRDIAEIAADAMARADSQGAGPVYGDGLTEMVRLFPGSEGAQQAIRVIEERAFLNMILQEMMTPMLNQVQVVVAGNGNWEELSHLSMVLSRYGVEGQISGAVGVLGPTNINYERAIRVVSYVSTLMSAMLVGALAPPEDESQS